MESMTTTDNGELDVHIAPIGEFKGSNSLGNPVPEKITKESLENLAEKLNKGDEILADIDHQSCKPGVERDTRAAGWFSKFVFLEIIQNLRISPPHRIITTSHIPLSVFQKIAKIFF